MTNKRSWMKVYPIVFVCMNTGSLHAEICGGYSTGAFITAYRSFVHTRGQPKFLYSDPGSQLVAAKKLIDSSEYTPKMQQDVDFDEVQRETAAYGVTWKLCPTESQWRDGRSESAIKALKKTIKHLHGGLKLNFAEFQTLLHQATDIINARPLGVRASNGAEPGYEPITPNTLLKASRTAYVEFDPNKFVSDNDKLVIRQKACDEILIVWWEQYMREVFDSLAVYKRWKKEQKNLEIGDICFLMTKSNLGAPAYRLCRVVECFPDAKELVRSVRVEMRPRDSRDVGLPYVSKGLVSQVVSVQRLVLVLPFEDQKPVQGITVNSLGANVEWPITFSSDNTVTYHDFYHVSKSFGQEKLISAVTFQT